jgi:hypothetical protein
MALEYLVICEFTVKDGPMRYVKELQQFRRANPGLAFLVKADKLFRKEVARLMRDERSTHGSFSATLIWVLDHKQHFWIQAEAQATLAMVNQGSPGPRKRPFPSDDQEGDKSDQQLSRKERKRQEFLGRKKAQRPAKPVQKAVVKTAAAGKGGKKPKEKGKGGGAPGSTGSDSRPKVPATEWAAVNKLLKGDKAKFCKFYNTSIGCHFNEDCSSTHGCVLCGGDHGWYECPKRGKQ